MMNEAAVILVVEDDEAHAELILRSFEAKPKRFIVHCAENLKTAQDKISQLRPDLIFTDWILPDGVGIDLIRRDGDGQPLYPAIIMTSFGNEEKAVEAMKAGALDYIVKSGEAFREMPHIARRALREWQHIIEKRKAEKELQQAHLDLLNAYETTLLGWCTALDLRDHETVGHTQRVVELTLSFARLLGLAEDELLHIKRGALLHDIGKMGIPDQILLKTGPLTDEEWVIMRKHPVYAHEWLCEIHYLQPSLAIPYCHHERWDGSGYPRGLKGEEIPLAARIFAIIDVWDALTSDRPYRAAWSHEETFAHIARGSGSHFDPQLIKILQREGIKILLPQEKQQ